METSDITFVIPKYRLRDVNETVECYDQHFWRNGHSVRIVVFDDSIPANKEKYFPLLEQTRTHNEIYYVGPREKDQFLAYLNGRLRDARLEGIVKNLFRPSSAKEDRLALHCGRAHQRISRQLNERTKMLRQMVAHVDTPFACRR